MHRVEFTSAAEKDLGRAHIKLVGGQFKLVRWLSRRCISPYRNQERVLQRPLRLDFDMLQQKKTASATQSAAPLFSELAPPPTNKCAHLGSIERHIAQRIFKKIRWLAENIEYVNHEPLIA